MLIGLNGKIGSGKDAFFERAVALAPTLEGVPTPERRAFADKLKDSFGALFGISREQIEEFKRDDQALASVSTPLIRLPLLRRVLRRRHSVFTIRLGLQRQGTEAGRDVFGDLFWVDQCVPSDLDHHGRLILVTDARFPNEVERIRAAGGVIVRMHGPAPVEASTGFLQKLLRLLKGRKGHDSHPSEQILAKELVDFEVDNTTRGDDFKALDVQVAEILLKLATDERKPPVRHPRKKLSSTIRHDQKLPISGSHPQ